MNISAGIKAIFVDILAFFFAFIGAGVLHGGGSVIPVAGILAVFAGLGDLAQSREKRVKQIELQQRIREQQIEREEIIREQVRRRMRDDRYTGKAAYSFPSYSLSAWEADERTETKRARLVLRQSACRRETSSVV